MLTERVEKDLVKLNGIEELFNGKLPPPVSNIQYLRQQAIGRAEEVRKFGRVKNEASL